MKKSIILILLLLISCSDKSTDPVNIVEKKFDYFPLSLGNWWLYNLDYKPYANDDVWWKAKVKWEIVGQENQNSNIIYKVNETINGIEILGNPINNDLDTNWIVDKINLLEFVLNEDGFIIIDSGTQFGSRPIIGVQKFHKDSIDVLTFDSFYSFPFSADSNLVHDDYTGHRIILKKNIGIKFWNIDNRSNSSPDGDLILIDYEIVVN